MPSGKPADQIGGLFRSFGFVWTQEGWLYLAVILDPHSRRVIVWTVSNRMKRDLAIRALNMATAPAKTAERLHTSHRPWQPILL